MDTCKISGCDRPSIKQMGRYARLCEVHKAEYIQIHGPGGRKKKNLYVSGNSKLRDVAVRLVEISERIDNSAADFHQARNSLIQDIAEFTRLLDSMKEDVKKIVNPNAN